MAGAESQTQEAVSQAPQAIAAPVQESVAAPVQATPSSASTEQPVQKAASLQDKTPYKSPPSKMPDVLWNTRDLPAIPPHIGSRPPRTDPLLHQPLSLQQVPRATCMVDMPTPPMSQLQPRAPDPSALFRGCAPPPGPVPSRPVPEVIPAQQAPPPWALTSQTGQTKEVEVHDLSPSGARHRLNMPQQMELMAQEGDPQYNVDEAGVFPFVIEKKEATDAQMVALNFPKVLYEDEDPTFVALNGVIEEQDANGTAYKIDRIKFANYMQTMTVASNKLQADMQILVWVHKVTHAEQLYRTVCHLQTLLTVPIAPSHILHPRRTSGARLEFHVGKGAAQCGTMHPTWQWYRIVIGMRTRQPNLMWSVGQMYHHCGHYLVQW